MTRELLHWTPFSCFIHEISLDYGHNFIDALLYGKSKFINSNLKRQQRNLNRDKNGEQNTQEMDEYRIVPIMEEKKKFRSQNHTLIQVIPLQIILEIKLSEW